MGAKIKKGLDSSPTPERKTQMMWRKAAICALVTLTKLEPTCCSLVGTCVLAIRAIKIPLHSATTEIVSLSATLRIIYHVNLP